MMITDQLIKDHNSINPLFGSAYYHPSLKRVESNVIDEHLLYSITLQDLDESQLFIQSIEFDDKTAIQNTPGRDCSVIERMVQKAENRQATVLKVKICASA